MVPASIISGFKVCGIYPFDPKAVLDHDPCTPPKEKPKQTSSTSGELECCTDEQEVHPQQKGSVNMYSAAEHFSPEEDALFAR